MTQQELPAEARVRQGALAVIYAFRSPGSGAVYVGKHNCDPIGWPKRGSGKLPDGYKGSGRIIRQVHRRHGEAVEWRILSVVSGGLDAINAAEVRAIRLVRRIWGRRCVNKLDGGNGHTSASARAYLSTPSGAAHLAGIHHRLHSPEVVAKRNAALREQAKRPERQRQIAEARAMTKTPEALAKLSATKRAFYATPEGKDNASRQMKAVHTPEVRAKAAASRRAFDATPEGKARRSVAALKAAATRLQKNTNSAQT